MRTILDKTTRDELIARVNDLNEQSQPQWGRMNVYQMLKHCAATEELYLSKKRYDRAFIGRIFGKLALRNVLKDDRPLGRNTPTLRELLVSETTGDLTAMKQEWIALLQEYANYTEPYIIHPFFGRITREQTGQMAYKHADHHLRQFGC